MKKALALLLALGMTFGAVPCSAEEAAAEQTEEVVEETTEEGEYKYKVAFTTIHLVNDTMVDQAENMKYYCAQNGIECVVYDNKNDASIAVQNAEIIARDGSYDAVLNFNVDSTVAQTISDIYTEAGIPFISIDVEHPNSPFFGANNELCGQMCGEFIVDYANENWDGEIDRLVLFDQLAAGEMPRQRVLNSVPTIEEGLGIEVDDMMYSFDYKDAAAAQSDFASYLQANPDAHKIAVICLNEDQFQGALAATETADRVDDVIIVTNNENYTIAHFEENPEPDCVGACVSFTFGHYGKWLAPTVVDLIEGREVDDYIYVGHELLTRENYKEFRETYPAKMSE